LTAIVRRFPLYFLPAIAVAAIIFGAFYAWAGIQAIRAGTGIVGYFLLLFGAGGIALGAALFTSWRRIIGRAVSKSRASESTPNRAGD